MSTGPDDDPTLARDVSERHDAIVEMTRINGRVTVDDLAAHFEVTPQTIRKDLNDLAARRRIVRVHGGAVRPSGTANLEYDNRKLIASGEKAEIAAAVARLIPDGASLFINIGTTTEQVAQALTAHRGLLAITNNINVANILRPAPGVEVVVAGGIVRRGDGGIVGEATVEFIQQFKVDYAVIGASAIDADGALLDYDLREVRVSQAIIRNARQVILVADGMKFTRSAPVRIGHLSQIDVFVTDAPLPEPLQQLAEEIGLDVQFASETN